MSTLWTKPFVFVSLANFFTFFGFQTIIPILPLYLDSWGASGTQVGLILSGFSLAVLIARPLTALGLERGLDKICVLTGAVICLAAIGGYGLAGSLLLLAFCRMLHGVGFGSASVSYGSIVARLVPPGRRAEGMGYFGMSIGLALCLGPVAGTYAYEYLGFSYSLIFAGFLTVLGIIWLSYLPAGEATAPTGKLKLHWRHFFEKRVSYPCLLADLFGISFGAIVVYVPLWGKELGINNVGFFFLLNAACTLFIRIFSGKLADRKGYACILLPAAFLQGLASLLLMWAESYIWLMGAGICMGLGLGAAYPTLQAWVVDLAPLERRGAALAFYYNAYDLGIGCGIIFFGWMADAYGYPSMYGISALSMVIYLASYTGYLLKKKRRP
ncbi:MAG: MFS transporter [Desulfarculales bacterium]|jgi:MFS family permease|nr:MFS transporter [Desulfarculales bacterium]